MIVVVSKKEDIFVTISHHNIMMLYCCHKQYLNEGQQVQVEITFLHSQHTSTNQCRRLSLVVAPVERIFHDLNDFQNKPSIEIIWFPSYNK